MFHVRRYDVDTDIEQVVIDLDIKASGSDHDAGIKVFGIRNMGVGVSMDVASVLMSGSELNAYRTALDIASAVYSGKLNRAAINHLS